MSIQPRAWTQLDLNNINGLDSSNIRSSPRKRGPRRFCCWVAAAPASPNARKHGKTWVPAFAGMSGIEYGLDQEGYQRAAAAAVVLEGGAEGLLQQALLVGDLAPVGGRDEGQPDQGVGPPGREREAHVHQERTGV